MIKRLEPADLPALKGWLERDVPLNLPMLGDLGRYGLAAPFLEFWAQVDDAGTWQTVVRRFFEHYIVYAPEGAPMREPEEIRFFLQFSNPGSVSGRADTMRAVLADTPGTWEESACMQLLSDSGLPTAGADSGTPACAGKQDADGLSIRATKQDADGQLAYASEQDAGEMGEIIFGTDAFRRNYHNAGEVAEGIRSRLRAGGVRHLVLRAVDAAGTTRIVSHANTTAELPGFALISGVTTRPEAQRRGHAARLVSRLCRDLLREGKTPCLFAKSPAALAMYLKLGFVCTGTYATWRPEE